MTNVAIASESQLPVLSSRPVRNKYEGTSGNSRRKYVTCDVCPAETKQSCTAVCREMEMFMAANANTIRHNSPLATGGQTDTLVFASDDAAGEVRQRNNRKDGKVLADFNTPEAALLAEERNAKATEILLQHIQTYCEKAAKTDRDRSIIEISLTLHFIEDYNAPRIAEILGERFEEFRGYDEYVRKTNASKTSTGKARGAGQKRVRPKGQVRIERIIARFKDFVRTTHFASRIKEVMATGSLAPMMTPVV